MIGNTGVDIAVSDEIRNNIHVHIGETHRGFEIDVKGGPVTREIIEADKLSEKRTIRLSGGLTGEVDFDGSEDVTIEGNVVPITNWDIERMMEE